jgi:hypothetical protein
MNGGRCDCEACRAYRLAIYLALAGLLILIGVGIHFVADSRQDTCAARAQSAK